MKREQLKKFPLGQVEWDFRKVDEPLWKRAALYEYARTSEKLRKRISDCLQSKIDRKRISEIILESMIWERQQKQPQSLMEMVKNPRKVISDVFPIGEIMNALFQATGGNEELTFTILYLRPDFPNPWTRVKFTEAPEVPKFIQDSMPGRVWLSPVNQFLDAFIEYQRKTGRDAVSLDELESWSNAHKSQLQIHIMWHGATQREIVSGFAKALSKEAASRAGLKKPGRAGQPPAAPLAWLAAYRMKQASVTFEQAQMQLQCESNPYGLLPRFENKSSWSDAIKGAKRILKGMESGLV